MGALAPISPWIPEDDLLLKNAVEEGGSLEALARGAVQFSRRYSIQELETRWHALLYDPDTSGPASAHMAELEHSASNLSSQSNRSGDAKGHGTPAKRKVDSVRSQYYAMRKRIRNEPFSNVDLSFLITPTSNSRQGQETMHNEHPVDNCMIRDPGADHFDLHGTNFDIVRHGFPQVPGVDTVMGGDEAAAHVYHSKHQDSFEGEVRDGIIGGNCLYEFEDVPHGLVNNVTGSDMPHSFGQDDMLNNINVLDEKSVFETHPCGQEIGPPGVPTGENLFETADLTTKSFCDFDLLNNSVPICAAFGQSQGFSSPVSDSGSKFQRLEYSSPVPTIPIWRTMEDMSTPSIMNNENLDDKDNRAGTTMVCAVEDAKQVSSSGYDVGHPDLHMEDRMSDEGLKISRAIAEGEFFDLSNSLLDFTNEEVLLLLDADGKDTMDRSCLDGISAMLLNSPNDVHQDDVPSFTEPKASTPMESCLMNPDVACSGDYTVTGDNLHSVYETCDKITMVSSPTSASNSHSLEYQNGVICCTLNTEDPDIPSNDDFIWPPHAQTPFASSILHNSEDGSSFLSPTMDFHASGMATELSINHAKEGEFLEKPGVTEPQFLPEMPSGNPSTSVIASEVPESGSVDTASKHIAKLVGEPNQCGSAHLAAFPAGELKEDTTDIDGGNHCKFDPSIDFLLESSGHCSDDNESHHQKMITDYKEEQDVPDTIQDHVLGQHGSFEMHYSEPVVNPLLSSDQKVQPSEEEDDDVPHFSDIEAVVLDMDLGPGDQDSYVSTEVSRYQHEEAKRAILRLEQGAHAYVQRKITAHRAFARLCGRRKKHYIWNPESLRHVPRGTKYEHPYSFPVMVSLGRATDDVSVDIDLAIEGCAKKISRRQAIIKIEADGSFSLKNLGKGLIVVDGKEVASGHYLKLSPGCMVKIRSMNFLFEPKSECFEAVFGEH